MLFYPNVKINLGLRVLGKRADGYHSLSSIFLPVKGLSDILEVVPAAIDSFKITGLAIEGSVENNLVFKALQIIKADKQIGSCHIHLHKILPMGAGLGGGSADGAFALLALNQVFELDFTITELQEKAAILGSDCPFFITNSPSKVSGRGEVIETIDGKVLPENLWISIVHPKEHISTKEAFAGLDLNRTFPTEYPLPVELGYDWQAWSHYYQNHFQDGACKSKPSVQKLIDNLKFLNPESFTAMTGSGSACYQISAKPVDLDQFKAQNYFTWQGKL
jgi:4-diphosphocytidyl-2-C-methyl-D-erythritol kinase